MEVSWIQIFRDVKTYVGHMIVLNGKVESTWRESNFNHLQDSDFILLAYSKIDWQW